MHFDEEMGFQYLGIGITVLSPSDPRPPTVIPGGGYGFSLLSTIRCCLSPSEKREVQSLGKPCVMSSYTIFGTHQLMDCSPGEPFGHFFPSHSAISADLRHPTLVCQIAPNHEEGNSPPPCVRSVQTPGKDWECKGNVRLRQTLPEIRL